MPPNQEWYCAMAHFFLFAATLSSALFILNMTFDRFYSIIRPHKAASFNTIKRARITIVCIVIFSIAYNIPHLFIGTNEGHHCIPYGPVLGIPIGQFYYWLSFTINFIIPFISLLIMNSFIIHIIRKSTSFRSEGQVQGQGQGSKFKSVDKQIYVILLLVTFGFLILITPSYTFFLYAMFYNYNQSAKSLAFFNLYYNIAQKSHYTNQGINFFLYVISGQKFRSDLVKLFGCPGMKPNVSHSSETVMSSV